MLEFNPKVSLYKNATSPKPIGTPHLVEVFDWIRMGKYQAEIIKLRGTSEEQQTAVKQALQAVTFSGVFKYRDLEPANFEEYTQLIHHDIDHLTKADITDLRSKLALNPYVFAFFVSPRGEGLKVLFRVSTGPERHLAAWEALGHYLHMSYGIPWGKKKGDKGLDRATKDVSRLCFLSHDPLMHSKELVTHEVAGEEFITQHTPPAAQPKGAKKPKFTTIAIDPTEARLEKCNEIALKPHPSGRTDDNHYVNTFAIQANRYGIGEQECADAIAQFKGWSAPDKGDMATIRSVYKKFSSEFGKWEQYSTSNGTPQPPASVNDQPALPAEDDEPTFWFTRFKKNRRGDVVAEEHQISYVKAVRFLHHHGFNKLQLRNDYQLIRFFDDGRIIDLATELSVKEYLRDYLNHKWKADELSDEEAFSIEQLKEKFTRSAKIIASSATLDLLPYAEPQIRRDTATTATLYFKNCYLEITADGIVTKQYEQLEGVIWQKQKRAFNYEPADWKTSEFATFITRAILGEKLTPSTIRPEQEQAMLSTYTTIGYLLHGYKSRSLVKAVIATDKVLRRGKENEGGTGKSLLANGIAQVIPATRINGKSYKPEDQFALQKVNADTRLINLDDARKGFDFTVLFSLLTEDFDWEKKGKDILTMSYEESPKWYISINTSMRGDGASVHRRQHIIEFSAYYNKRHQPQDEFGHEFFSGWEHAEWCSFYSFMAHCEMMYLKEGLVPFPTEHYEMNKLIDAAGEDFVDFMDDRVKKHVEDRTKHEWTQDELFDAWNAPKAELKKWQKNSFTKRVKEWAEATGLVYNPGTDGERDRRGGVVYFTFAAPGELLTTADSSTAQTDMAGDDGTQETLPF